MADVTGRVIWPPRRAWSAATSEPGRGPRRTRIVLV